VPVVCFGASDARVIGIVRVSEAASEPTELMSGSVPQRGAAGEAGRITDKGNAPRNDSKRCSNSISI
jgi:hypothetical protein